MKTLLIYLEDNNTTATEKIYDCPIIEKGTTIKLRECHLCEFYHHLKHKPVLPEEGPNDDKFAVGHIGCASSYAEKDMVKS